MKKPLKVIIVAMGIVVLTLALYMIGWNIVKYHRLQSSLQDVYFMEYGDGGTNIYKYDVSRSKTVTVAALEGGRYSDCKINRTENYIIGEFWRYKEDTTVLLRYNLSDDTMEEITGEDAEIMEERIKEGESKFPERSSLPEEVRRLATNRFIGWSEDEEKAVFYNTKQDKIYLYNANTETCECILTAGLNQTFGPPLGLDASGKYLYYKNNFIHLLQTADIKIIIYDIETGMRTKIHERRDTQHPYEFVQEMF